MIEISLDFTALEKGAVFLKKKGGDFMEKQPDPAKEAAAFQEATNRLQGIRESEVPYPAGYDLGIDPNQGRIPGTKEDPFPKVVGRTRSFVIPTPVEVATTINAMGEEAIDRATLRSVSDMD